MNIKRYFAPDTRRAINMVRAEHGPDAVILSSETVEGGVEIIAAVDYDQGLMSLLSGRERHDQSAEAAAVSDEPRIESVELRAVPPEHTLAAIPVTDIRPEAAPADALPAASARSYSDTGADTHKHTDTDTDAAVSARSSAVAGADTSETAGGSAETRAQEASGAQIATVKDTTPEQPTEAPGGSAEQQSAVRADQVMGIDSTQELRAIQRDLFALKGMVRERIAWADMRGHSPQRSWLMRKAEAFGLTPELADTLVKEVEHLDQDDRAWREVIFGMARRILVMREDPLDKGGIIALVGPTGVGKTTTIAKLAARHCMRKGPGSLALVTTDSNRIGAHRQLEAFGAILGVPVRRADTPEELAARLKELSDRDLVLIDTAGAAPRDAAIAQLLQKLDKRFEIMQFLVLAANMQAAVMCDAIRGFGGKSLSGAVLTKLDEASGLGAALSVLIEANLPAVWISEGQRVPEDLRLARVANLLKRAAVLGESEEQPTVPAFVAANAPADKRGDTYATAH